MARAWLHHLHAMQSTDKPFDAMRYLYERLNVIDRKASVILRLNLLILTFLTVMASILLRDVLHAGPSPQGSHPLTDLYSGGVAYAVIGIVVCVALSASLTFAIGDLRLDYVTTYPSIIANQRVEWRGKCGARPTLAVNLPGDGTATTADRTPDSQPMTVAARIAQDVPDPSDRKIWPVYRAKDWQRIFDTVEYPLPERQSAFAFDNELLRIIIARQRMLWCARITTSLALMAYLYIFSIILWSSCIIAGIEPFTLPHCPT